MLITTDKDYVKCYLISFFRLILSSTARLMFPLTKHTITKETGSYRLNVLSIIE